jgi:glycosyltransferase involved in cell wall biosynthesis
MPSRKDQPFPKAATGVQAGRLSLLVISYTYFPVVGGCEIEAHRICSALIGRGYKILVLCSGGPPMPILRDWLDPAGVPVRILTRYARGRCKEILFAIRVAWTLWRERADYDVVYFIMQGLHLAAGLPVARALRKPIVMKFSGSSVIPLVRRSRAGRVELNWLRKWAARLLILNDGMMQEAIEDGFTAEQLTWMPNPVDSDEFRPGKPAEIAALRERHGIKPDACVAIYVGRLSSEKGLCCLLRGFAQAARSVSNFALLLVGDGTLRPELEALVRELGLSKEQVRFVGQIAISQVSSWLRASDIFVLVSPNEGFSCALAESMSSGLPSVVSQIPGNAQLIDEGVHGLTVPVGDADAIAGALIKLFQDPPRRKHMGEAARRRIIENYSSREVVDRYLVLFDEVVQNSP